MSEPASPREEPAALDLAAIREWVEQARAVADEPNAEWLEPLTQRNQAVLGGSVLDALTRLVDELERCRAERDALRDAAEMFLHADESGYDSFVVGAALDAAHKALGEVTQ